jgi:hypothetical protein
MEKHVAGNPKIVVENVTGEGSLVAAIHVYNWVKPDGLTIGSFIGRLFMEHLLGTPRVLRAQEKLGKPGIEFDARRFEFVGVPLVETPVCAITKASGITSLEQWMASKVPVRLGGLAPGSQTDDVPKTLMTTVGLPIELISGYKSTAHIREAADKGEISGGCWGWELMKVTWRKALDSGDVNIVFQASPKAHPDLPKVPLAINLAKSDEARKLIQAGIHDINAITRLYVLPPGTSKEQVQILRKAFMDTMKDPEFLAEAKDVKLDIDPMSGEEVEKTVGRLFSLDPSLVSKLKEILK